jgi:hypothetical protein
MSQAKQQKVPKLISHWQQSLETAAKSLMWNDFCCFSVEGA